MQLDDATTILGRADFFEVCDAEQRRLLAFASERKKFKPGTVIYQAGDVPEGAHVLVSGTVATYQDGDESDPFVVSSAGAVLGAMSLVVARPRPVTVKAIDNVETLFVPRSGFLKLCNQSPELARRAAERVRKELTAYLSAVEKVKGKIGGGRS
ncbi:MAG TPA: cyclic nucleotide-binding domain-containing protein [Devosia sp.]|nr:cyclic nucleotide-binding domain-containing protein [Devosia sp.]